ncbi:NUDIX domain-containing protein [Sphingomonas sp. A2-49]|uniref:NUDIX domain-containing protein n=1 Tax=Sphingomonas sp. A2-49 TaxID=1391375 RepID=UPI0021D23B68|nr:NUDIX domain-containing protein [Sphingomonas sp. A2-49]MCU6454750.1 NUDIX domain-containing protein [Sphingomonas sp. A2-49]
MRRWALALLGWRTRGVKVMAFDGGGRLLLVRHRYGRSDLWMLPGGGMARGESAVGAAARELREETRCVLRDAVPVSAFESSAEGRRDTVTLIRGRTDDPPVADGVELAEARFFPPGALPSALSPATARRIAEWRGERTADGRW